METIRINGGRKLGGEIDIQGSKNAALPILAACVLADGVSVIHNCPVLTDVFAAVEILRHLGCTVKRQGHTLTVDSRNISCYTIPVRLMSRMRSSIVFLGSILSRMGKAELCAPGGCEIGLRPIDLHLSALRSMGVEIDESKGTLYCTVKDSIKANVITLSFPSVGATENIMLAAVFAKGTTTILNAAREPEIGDLAAFLNRCGCRVNVSGGGTIVIEGVKKAHGAEHTVIPDRIVTLTYMAATAAAGGDVLLKRTQPQHFLTVNHVFEKAGCDVTCTSNSVRISRSERLRCVRDIRTMPYPGFPTDAQAPVMAMLCLAKGTSVIVENIFESRFKHVCELARMGAKIKIEDKVALIDGVENLFGADVNAIDLRAGGSLAVAGVAARGTTVISSVHHIDRGYENIVGCLQAIGADAERSDTDERFTG